MSISAMKQALEALEEVQRYDKTSEWFEKKVSALRQAIAEAEKQEPVAWREVAGKTTKYYDYNEDGRGEPLYAAPVHDINMSQERVDETAKCGHEPAPNDYDRSIHNNPDAQAWAKFFMATVKEQEWCIDDIDESLMLGWFANAMMAMHDHVKREWVGLDGDIPGLGLVTEEFYNGMLCAEDILRKRNT
jgi:hypothetical protein